MSGKHLQLFISHNMGCQYYVGSYDTQRDLFVPEGDRSVVEVFADDR